MTEFEKAELIRQRANVSFEEARDALNACGGDPLDAMLYLERLGHVNRAVGTGSRPSGSSSEYTNTRYTSDPVPPRGYNGNYGPTESRSEGFLSRLLRKSVENDLVVSQHGFVKFRVPILAFVLALIFFNAITLIAMIVSLFFGVTYRIEGKADTAELNRAMEQVGNRAANWWENRNVSPEVRDLCRKYDNMDRK